MTPECPELEGFVRGELDVAAFPHREHVRMAFEMLRRHDFAESAWLYSRALRAMTAKAGKPQAFHQTVTIAFLAMISERMERSCTEDFAAFVAVHPETLDPRALGHWYSLEQLASEVARRTFVLPAPSLP